MELVCLYGVAKEVELFTNDLGELFVAGTFYINGCGTFVNYPAHMVFVRTV